MCFSFGHSHAARPRPFPGLTHAPHQRHHVPPTPHNSGASLDNLSDNLDTSWRYIAFLNERAVHCVEYSPFMTRGVGVQRAKNKTNTQRGFGKRPSFTRTRTPKPKEKKKHMNPCCLPSWRCRDGHNSSDASTSSPPPFSVHPAGSDSGVGTTNKVQPKYSTNTFSPSCNKVTKDRKGEHPPPRAPPSIHDDCSTWRVYQHAPTRTQLACGGRMHTWH